MVSQRRAHTAKAEDLNSVPSTCIDDSQLPVEFGTHTHAQVHTKFKNDINL